MTSLSSQRANSPVPLFLFVRKTAFTKVTKVMDFPLPRSDDVIYTLGESNVQIFSFLDMFSGYWEFWWTLISFRSVFFSKSQRGKVCLKPSKSNAAVKNVKYLGNTISKDGISVDKLKVEAVKSLAEPKNPTDIGEFLGLANYCRKFIHGFCRHCYPPQ